MPPSFRLDEAQEFLSYEAGHKILLSANAIRLESEYSHSYCQLQPSET
jgi:hypothetical protein